VTIAESSSSKNDDKGFFEGMSWIPILVLVAIIVILLGVFIYFKGSKVDDIVRSEKQDADIMYEEDMEALEE
jgi:uncharacterized membrane protein